MQAETTYVLASRGTVVPPLYYMSPYTCETDKAHTVTSTTLLPSTAPHFLTKSSMRFTRSSRPGGGACVSKYDSVLKVREPDAEGAGVMLCCGCDDMVRQSTTKCNNKQWIGVPHSRSHTSTFLPSRRSLPIKGRKEKSGFSFRASLHPNTCFHAPRYHSYFPNPPFTTSPRSIIPPSRLRS